MNPRGYLGTFIMIASITALPFALLWSLLFSLGTGMDFGQVLQTGLWLGIAFGFVVGFIMAFFLQAIAITRHVKDKNTFVNDINIILAKIGYRPRSQFGDFLTYKSSFQTGLLAGDISVQIKQDSATIIGPSMYVKKLDRWLNALD